MIFYTDFLSICEIVYSKKNYCCLLSGSWNVYNLTCIPIICSNSCAIVLFLDSSQLLTNVVRVWVRTMMTVLPIVAFINLYWPASRACRRWWSSSIRRSVRFIIIPGRITRCRRARAIIVVWWFKTQQPKEGPNEYVIKKFNRPPNTNFYYKFKNTIGGFYYIFYKIYHLQFSIQTYSTVMECDWQVGLLKVILLII